MSFSSVGFLIQSENVVVGAQRSKIGEGILRMVKSCSMCGSANPDEAAFCMNCGGRLQSVATTPGWQSQPQTPPSSASSYAAPSPQQAGPTVVASYVAQLQTGKHKHMLTDIGFKDQSGGQIMVAQKHSLFGFEYDLLDSYGNLMGHIKHHALSLHDTFDATGPQHELVGKVKHQLLGSMVFQDNFWFEDAAGQKTATVTGDALNYRFALASTATSGQLATVQLDFPGGFIRDLKSYGLGRYLVEVYSNELNPIMLAAFLVALEHRRESQNQV